MSSLSKLVIGYLYWVKLVDLVWKKILVGKPRKTDWVRIVSLKINLAVILKEIIVEFSSERAWKVDIGGRVDIKPS